MPAANILQQAIMPIADHNICDRTTGLRVIEKAMVCAGGQGISSGCKVHVKGALSRDLAVVWCKLYKYLTKNLFSDTKLLLEHQEKIK